MIEYDLPFEIPMFKKCSACKGRGHVTLRFDAPVDCLEYYGNKLNLGASAIPGENPCNVCGGTGSAYDYTRVLEELELVN